MTAIQLETELRRHLAKLQGKRSRFTIGVEHEFFLLNSEGKPVSHAEGQAFLAALAKVPQWYIREELNESGEKLIWRVSKDTHDGRFTAVKYDHHPHLFEIAFGYENNLHALFSEVLAVLQTVRETATYLGLRIGASSNIELDPMDPQIVSPLSYFKDLRYYRSILLQKRFGAQVPSSQNYAATIAATQFHVGATEWWNRESYVEKLYCLEPILLDFVTSLSSITSPTTFFRKRWQGYREVFQGFPLVGYPTLPNWDITQWSSALISSPLAGGPNDLWAGNCLKDLTRSPFNGSTDFLGAVRDLQLIRPKLYGTLEFRADPSLGSAQHIVAMAALRLGLCEAIASEAFRPSLSFMDAHDLWWKKVTSNYARASVSMYTEVISLAKRGLALRKYDEAHHLAAFDDLLKREAA
ncbi:MAG: hypothetical protein ACJ763_13635 [Bdellovibrionia bacterium]